jgi:hypothetical protein
MVHATRREQEVNLRIRDRASVGLWAHGVIIFSIAFAGCGTDDEAPATNQSGITGAVTPVGIVGVYEATEFYPACGNETLDHQGVTWFPLVRMGFNPVDPNLQDRIDEVLSSEREESPVAGVHGFARVVAPGPGDDIGTLVVWADGVARWVSDSGNLDVWMIDDSIRYTWDC